MSVDHLETKRLRLRRLVPTDAPFILDLLNQPSFLEHIGDKGVRDLDGARGYIRDGPAKSHAQHGYGLDLVVRTDGDSKEADVPIGICGLVRRDTLPHADLGYAFHPDHWRHGFAREAARAVVADARQRLGIGPILAIVSPGNAPSIRLLEDLGFRRQTIAPLEANGDPVLRMILD